MKLRDQLHFRTNKRDFDKFDVENQRTIVTFLPDEKKENETTHWGI